jgi:hypothetical protein
VWFHLVGKKNIFFEWRNQVLNQCPAYYMPAATDAAYSYICIGTQI